ncbi:Metal-dependent hydrolase YbeY, involved in rRNA and/or ribosome maturation and assembly [hydrothermal vent metagenome]|uniref:Metal-dependent hydrolase YbeY, involved in rRNA and/or ribosome maturation and assembly n=1 Tax=hydrothermal vent metagenome TaxID=652676 RepID=A0A3B0R3B4_9ZZZZ
MTADNITLDISVDGGDWTARLPDYRQQITACFRELVAHVPLARHFDKFNHLELSILLTDDKAIQKLNRDYRHKDRATNVLSFPSLSGDEVDLFLKQGQRIPDYPVSLGDIIFACETLSREAHEQGKSFRDHFCHLCLHGMVHLLGYDHVDVDQAEDMERLEKELLSKLSIDDPYQD